MTNEIMHWIANGCLALFLLMLFYLGYLVGILYERRKNKLKKPVDTKGGYGDGRDG